MTVDDIRSMTIVDYEKTLESPLMKNGMKWLVLLIVSWPKTNILSF